MNQNQPRQSLGDTIDRITILSLKIHYGEEEAYKEHTYLTECITSLGLKLSGALLSAIIRLSHMNRMIWELENEIRKGADSLSMQEIGARALKIRDLNRKRVRYKNEINRLSGLGYREFKVHHRSQ